MRELNWWIVGVLGVSLALGITASSGLAGRTFLVQNWGNLASVLGLFVAFLAAIFSSRASAAARQARDSVLSRSLEEEISQGHKLVSDLAMLLEIGKLELASSKSNDLLDVPTRIRIRWEKSLSTASKDNWLLAKQQLDSIHEVLSNAAAATLSPEELQRVARTCRAARTIFAEEQATAMGAADRGHDGQR